MEGDTPRLAAARLCPVLQRPRRAKTPSLDVDMYSNKVLDDPSQFFSALRQAGRVVWLPHNRIWAIGGYEDIRAALRADTHFVSGKGVATNGMANSLGHNTTLASDGETHVRRRRILMQSLGAKALELVQPAIDHEAGLLIDNLVDRRHFDGIADFASRLPVNIVAKLVGVRVPAGQMLKWASSTFNALGPLNWRSISTITGSLGMLFYAQRLSARTVVPGSWAATVFAAADRGELSAAEARTMIIDFVAPSLDTTILAAGELLWRLGTVPDLWDEIRSDASLIPSAVVEAVRLASPIRAFTRMVAEDIEFAGAHLKKGDRVALVFASGNTDERQFPNPETFDLRRPAGGHLGWGNGPHTCVGMHLAKYELGALLRAMVDRVASVDVGRPARLRNNTLQGYASFDAVLRGVDRSRLPPPAA